MEALADLAATTTELPHVAHHFTLAKAFRHTSRLYRRNLLSFLAMYLLFMSVPMLFQIYFVRTYSPADFARTDKSTDAFEAFLTSVPPSDPHYFVWAFARLFGALITPFAVASLVIAIKNLIQSGKPLPFVCFRTIGRKWLTIAQFGIIMHIVWYLATEVLQNVNRLSIGHNWNNTTWVLLLLLTGYMVIDFAYSAALVAVALDGIDPIRALCFGIWFAIRYTFSSLGRFLLLLLLGITSALLVMFLNLSSNANLGVSVACELLWSIFSSWASLAMVLFVLDKLAQTNYGNVPEWLKLR